MVTSEQIKTRMFGEIFDQTLMDNTFRGIWCEYMIAEALGEDCKAVGAGWNAWDLQIGECDNDFPKRVRIQVKNSARLQIWNRSTGRLSDCQFNLTFRKRPGYFVRDTPNTPCEEYGFLCDLYILCLHKEEDVNEADQTDPKQWVFYLVPVVGEFSAVTPVERAYALDQCRRNKKPSSCIRRPGTLEKGIRGRPPVLPIGIDDLNINLVYKSLGVARPSR